MLFRSLPQYRPDAAESATDDLVELVRRGFVIVTLGRWQENETTPLPLLSAEATLRDATAWQPTGRQAGFVLELTAEGRQFLREHGIQEP